MTRKLTALLLAALMLLAAIPATAETAVTLTDMAGREVKLDAPASRIVVLMPSDCEILYAIGAGDAVVGRGEYCNYPAEAEALPVVNSGMETNLEEILALEPQVVVMTKMAQTAEHVDALENAGVRVFVTDAQTIADTYDCISLLGKLTGKTAEAEAVIADMQERIAAVAAKAENTGKTVYFETTPMEFGWGLYSAGMGNFMDEIGAICGLNNIFGNVEYAWPVVSEEDVIAADPDYIVTIDSNGMGDVDAAQVILAREGWKDMQAVVNGNVFIVGNDEFSRPGPRLADAAEALYALIYGAAEAAVPAA